MQPIAVHAAAAGHMPAPACVTLSKRGELPFKCHTTRCRYSGTAAKQSPQYTASLLAFRGVPWLIAGKGYDNETAHHLRLTLDHSEVGDIC